MNDLNTNIINVSGKNIECFFQNLITNDIKELENKMAKNQNPFPRAEAFSVHEIIDPRETRKYISLWAERIQHQLRASLIKRDS